MSEKIFNDLIWIHSQKEIDDFRGISDFLDPKDHMIHFLKDKKYLRNIFFKTSVDGLLIVCEKLWDTFDEIRKKEIINIFSHVAISKTIDDIICKISRYYHSQLNEDKYFLDGRKSGLVDIHPTADISENVFIGPNTIIGENVRIFSGCRLIGDCHIGDNTVLYPNVVIYPNSRIGNDCRIHSSSVIGADGFGYNFINGKHKKIWHLGGVKINNQVEIGAHSAIDRGTFSDTVVGSGSKIDNHVQIGHNCLVGENVIICGHVAIGGSTKIGNYTVFGGKSGTGPGLNIGTGCQIAGGALVNCDWGDNYKLGGHPARPLNEWLRGLAAVRKLISKRK